MTAEAVQLGKRLGSPISELLARVFKGLVHHLRGESELVREESQVLVSEGDRLNLQLPLGFGHILAGAVRAIEQADPAGVAEIEEGMTELTSTGGAAGAPIAFVLLAESHLATGAAGTAREMAQAGLDVAETLDQHFVDAELLRIDALAARVMGTSTDETAALLDGAVDAAQVRGQTCLALRAACDLAALRPQATPLVRELLSGIEGGRGTRDQTRAESILTTQDS
jgi:hypothetical protein